MDTFYMSIILAGFGGGAVRNLVGFAKQFSFTKPVFDLKYFLMTMLTSGAVGLIAAVVTKELDISILGISGFTPAIAFLVGYAGGDLLDNLYKIILRKPTTIWFMTKISYKKLFLIAIVIFAGFGFVTKAQAATGDITAVRIINDTCTVGTSCNGWVAEIDIEGLSTGGTYDFGLGANNDPTNAKIVFTVTSPGYDTSGNVTTIIRTIYGTYQVRKPYPNNATMDESSSGGTLTVRVALSDFIYSGDTNITVNIGSGFYTQGTANSSATGVSVTNNSTLSYPKSVGRWAWPAFEKVTDNFLLESVIFNRFAQNGKPVAAVKYTCTDEHSNTVTQTVNNMTVSTRTGDANKVLVYAATIPVSTLTQGDTVTCNFTAYPWVGNSGALLNSDLIANGGDGYAQPDERLGPFTVLLDKTGAYGGAFAVVDATNGQASTASTWVYSSQSAAETAYGSASTNSYNTIGRAVQAIKSYNNTNYSRNEPGGGVILLNAGNHGYPSTTPASDLGVQDTWLTIEPMSTVSKSQAVINACSNASMKTRLVKVSGITVNSNCTGQFVGTVANNVLWLHNNNLTVAGSAPAYAWALAYATQNSVTTFNGGFTSFSTNRGPWGLFRGNTVTPEILVTMYAVLGNTGKFTVRFEETGNTRGHQMSEGSIVAFNTIYGNTGGVGGGATWDLSSSVNNGFAVVQNVVEKTTGTTALMLIASDISTANPANNIMIWHNTLIGERLNAFYNDTNINGGSPLPRTNESVRGNLFDRYSTVTDVDSHGGTADGARTGNWSVRHGLGYASNIFASYPYIGEFIGTNSIKSSGALGAYDLKYTNNASYTGTASGNGDYHLLAGSPALNLIASGQSVLPYDLEGNARHNNGYGAAGAYEWDVAAPSVTAFNIPATASSLTVDITTFTASDAVGVTGYKLTESSTAPAWDASGWSGSAPATYTFSSAGSKTLYAWAKDAVGNVSTSANDTVTITLPTYTIGGTTSGLTGTVVLQNNTGDDESVSTGSFTFDTALADSAAYAVTVLTQPSGQTCTVTNGSGNVASSNVTNVVVTCTTDITPTPANGPVSSGGGGGGHRNIVTTSIPQSTLSFTFTKNLSYGSEGQDVTELQKFLTSQGYLTSDNITGYFGSKTQSALQAFQKASGIVSSGTPQTTGYGNFGATTRAKINSMLGGSASQTSLTSGNSGQSVEDLQALLASLQKQLVSLLTQLIQRLQAN